MSKKKLLSEAQVRRFMGLAGINPLNEMSHHKKDDEMHEMRGSMKKDDEMREMRGDMKKDDEMHEMRGDMKKDDEMREMRGDMKKDDELHEQEEPEMDEPGDADVEMDEEDLADVKSALDMLQDKLGPLLAQAEGGDMGDEDMDMDMKDDEDMDMDMKDDEDMDMDKELQEVDMELTEEEIVNEVARRVAKRIVEAKRAHNKMNEALGRNRRK